MSTPFWKGLPLGFHHRRCVVDGELGFEVFIWRGENANEKILLLNGATHGDEWEGPLCLSEIAHNRRPQNLRGTLIVVPVLNEAAFFAARRESPLDEKNLARVFPGNPNGTPTEKLAHAFQNSFLAHASFYADFHSAGAAYEIFPWAGYVMHGDENILSTQRGMASCFPDVWHWGTPYLPGRTLSAAHELGIPAIYIECRGAGGAREDDLTRLRAGFESLLRFAGLIAGEANLFKPRGVRESTLAQEGHLQIENPSPCDGLLIDISEVGAQVKAGDLLALIEPIDGGAVQEVLSAARGRVMMTRRFRAIRKGDALAVIVDF